MFSVYVRSERNPRDADMVKLMLVFHRTGYNRTGRRLLISGPYSEWNKKSRAFESNSGDNAAKNKIIQQERIKYLKIAEKWEYSGKEWSPIELANFYDAGSDHFNRNSTVSQIFDLLASEYADRKRYRNGKLFTGKQTSELIRYIRGSFERFTQAKYRKDFSRYQFKDINRKFLLDYLELELKRGARNGNRANVDVKLRRLRQTFFRAKELGVYSVNIEVFDVVGPYLKPQRTFSKAISHETMLRIEQMDRSGFLKREKLYIDLFLFSYYAGGMTGIDICYLEHSWIENNIINYERIKYPHRARIILSDKAIALIEKYRGEGYLNYVFPVFKKEEALSSMIRQSMRKIRDPTEAHMEHGLEQFHIEDVRRGLYSNTGCRANGKLSGNHLQTLLCDHESRGGSCQDERDLLANEKIENRNKEQGKLCRS